MRKEFITTFGKEYEKDHNAHDVISLSMAAVENIADAVCELVTMINEK